MLRTKKIYTTVFKNYYISKFQKTENFVSTKYSNYDIFLTTGGRNEVYVKDVLAYLLLMFGQKPKFTFKKQSKQNQFNHFMYFKITQNGPRVLPLIEKIAHLILPHQENYLLTRLPSVKENCGSSALVFLSCMTNEEIQFLPKSRAGSLTADYFNLSLNFSIKQVTRPNLLFFFRFHYFPLN